MNLMCSFITLNVPYERESLKDYWKSFVQLKNLLYAIQKIQLKIITRDRICLKPSKGWNTARAPKLKQEIR